jgi:hypothetical protein
VLENLEFDDAEAPTIGLVADGTSWEQVQDHIKIAHHPLLVPMPDTGTYVGAYWAGTQTIVTEDLGPDQDQAIEDFRSYLLDRGET